MKTKIFHNPRCSKSRLALSLLQKSQIEIEIIEYLKKPPSYQDILNILKMLNIKPIDLIRKREVLFKELELEKHIDDNHMLVEAMVNNPILKFSHLVSMNLMNIHIHVAFPPYHLQDNENMQFLSVESK